MVERVLELTPGVVERLLHLGPVERGEEAFLLVELRLEDRRVLHDRALRLLRPAGRLEQGGIELADLTLQPEHVVGEVLGRRRVGRDLVAVTLRALLGRS